MVDQSRGVLEIKIETEIRSAFTVMILGILGIIVQN